MPNQPEGRLQLRIQKALKEQYGRRLFVFKVHGSALMMTGLPDLIGCVDGRFFALEVKMPGGKVSDVQQYVMSRVRAAGGIVGVPRSVADALAIIAKGITPDT
jgi:hypothetical protein